MHSLVIVKIGFKNRGLTYVYSNEDRTFSAVEFPIYRPFQEIRNKFLWGNHEEEVPRIQEVFGKCEINFEVPSHVRLFFREILQPFFLFQILSVTIWCLTDYYIFAAFITVVSITTAIINLITVRKNFERIHELVHFGTEVDLYRREKGKYMKSTGVKSRDIVPGDLLVIKDHFRMPCDCVLLNGQLLVDECALTGESVPMSKYSIPDNSDKYMATLHKVYSLYEGTVVVQKLGNQNVETLALVIRTSFSTLRGQLVRGILYPKASNLKFERDSYYLILLLLVVLLCGLSLGIPPQLGKVETYDIVLSVLGMVTNAIPASLPVALTVATSFSLIRYRKNQINCISPKRIIAAGRVDCVCFDKTGIFYHIFFIVVD